MMARLFALTVLVYPLALALLCVGAGLLIDRCSGGFLPAALLPSVGAAALIALSQLSTYAAPLAPATPYLIAVAAVSGFALARRRVRGSRSPRLRPSMAARPAGARLPARARARAAGRAAELLLLHGPVGLRRAHDRRRLPDPPRPGLRAPGPAQLLRPVHPQLLRHELPLRRGHAVRRQRVPPAPAADLGLSAVQRVHARDRQRTGVAARARGSACAARGRRWRRSARPCPRSSTATS